MSVCLAAALALHGDALVYAGPGGATWRLPVAGLRLVGEFTAPGDGECLLAFCVDAGGAWFQAPRHAAGAEVVLAALGAAPAPEHAARAASRVLWPPTLAGEALFDFATGRTRLRAALCAWLADAVAAPRREV